jgi:hypothetical protein
MRLRRRAALVRSTGGSVGDLRALDARIEEELLSLTWTSSAVVREARAVLEAASSPLSHPELGVVLAGLEGDEGLARFVTAILGDAGGKEEDRCATVDALRFSPRPEILGRVRQDLLPSPAFRPHLVPLLCERRALPDGDLVGLVEAPDDGTSAAAAAALGWRLDLVAGRDLRSAALRTGGGPRGGALLLAAALLGDRQAVLEARERVDGGDFSAGAIEALAAGGDERDVARLVDAAGRMGRAAFPALLAAAHLGSATFLDLLPKVRRRLTPAQAGELRRAFWGGTPGRARALPRGVRLFRGERWSVGRVGGALADPDLTLAERRRLVADLVVRTGLSPSAPFGTSSLARVQDEACRELSARLAGVEGATPTGRWLFYGRAWS